MKAKWKIIDGELLIYKGYRTGFDEANYRLRELKHNGYKNLKLKKIEDPNIPSFLTHMFKYKIYGLPKNV